MTNIEILASTATRTQGHAAAAWRDIQAAKTANYSEAQMKPLLANYIASRAAEMEALTAWQAALAAA